MPENKTQQNLDQLIQKARGIFAELQNSEDIKSNEGKYIAIEVISGKHFIADTRDEAVKKAKIKFPDRLVFVRRIGGLEKASRHLASPVLFDYARLF